MLVIRMQRTGRKGLAQFRVVVQDSRQTPTSGKSVASLGHYDPHSKTHGVDIEKATYYMEHGAQPSSRVARLLQSEGVKLPDWVKLDTAKSKKLKDADKLRKNQKPEPAEEASTEESAPTVEETPSAEEPTAEEVPVSDDTPKEEA